MSVGVEFGSRAGANRIRDRFDSHLCPVDDDRRTKTVFFQGDTPKSVIQQAEAEAAEDRAADAARSNTESLTDAEREKIRDADGFDQTTTTANWRSAKGVFAREGLSDQFIDQIGGVADYEDPIEGAEAAVERYQRTGQGGGARDVGEEDVQRQQKEAKAAQRVQGEGCNHADDHCRHGDPEACEYLTEACGYPEEQVDRILGVDDRDLSDATDQQTVTVGGGDYAEMEVSPEQAGALNRSWQGYKGAVSRLDAELSDVREAAENARQAMQTINRIREENGHDPLHPDRLHDLLETLEAMPGSIPETRTLDHFRGEEGEDPDPDTEPAEVEGWDGPDTEDDGTISWRMDRPEMEGGSVVLMVKPQERGPFWEVRAGYLDLLEAVTVDVLPDESSAVERAMGWLRNQGRDPPSDPDGVVQIYEGDKDDDGRLTNSEKARHVTDVDPLEADPQRDLTGDRANDQTRFTAGERGEDDGETIDQTETNPGGLEADRREETNSETDTRQARPDAFRVAEGGQETL